MKIQPSENLQVLYSIPEVHISGSIGFMHFFTEIAYAIQFKWLSLIIHLYLCHSLVCT